MKYIFTSDDQSQDVFKKLFLTVPDKVAVTKDYSDLLNPDSPNNLYNQDTSVLVYSREVYDYMKSFDTAGKIHFGLRYANYMHIYQMEVLTINKCKFYFINHNDPLNWYKDKIKEFYKYNPETEPKYELKWHKIYTCDDGIEGLNRFSEDQLYGFDFESKSFPDHEDFEPVGIGIATRTEGIYIDFRYYSSEEVRDKFMAEFKKWIELHHNKLICYYASFEVNALRRMFKNFYPLLDAMAMVKADDRSGSLKLNAQNYLHVASWDDYQDELMKALDEVFARCRKYEDIKWWKDQLATLLPALDEIESINKEITRLNGIIDSEASEEDKAKAIEDRRSMWEKLSIAGKKKEEVLHSVNDQIKLKFPDLDIITDTNYEYYFNECLDKIIAAKFDPVMYDKYHGHPFAATPKDVTGLYCIYDAFYTINMFEVIDERYHYTGTKKSLF